MYKLSEEELSRLNETLSSVVCPACGRSSKISFKEVREGLFICSGLSDVCCDAQRKRLTDLFNEERERLISQHIWDVMSM